nr:ABC transporter permease [Nonomuraea maritima]
MVAASQHQQPVDQALRPPVGLQQLRSEALDPVRCRVGQADLDGRPLDGERRPQFVRDVRDESLLVGGIGIANVMIISVLERRQEIGLRRSLGATRGQIRLQFVVEAVVLSLCGGVTGTVVGLAVSLLFAAAQGWPLALPTQVITLGVTAAVLVGIVSGLYPARRAAALTPTEALATG